MNEVRVGQRWSSNGNGFVPGQRFHYTVMSIDAPNGRVAVRWEGKKVRGGTVLLRKMEHGTGGHRLEVDSDGTVHRSRPRCGMPMSKVEKTTASDHRKVTPPRGLTPGQRERWMREHA